MIETMEKLGCAVIGAGWFGLASAKTFHQLHPDRNLAVLEGAETPGGVWAAHRLYPGLKSNNMLGTYEYPDFPMDTATFGVKPGEHIPGPVIYRYLTAYAETFGIKDMIRCGHNIVPAEHLDGCGWVLTVQRGLGERKKEEVKIHADRLVVATGLTSEAFLPHIQGQETFGGPVFHGKDFLQHADTVETAKSVTVFGGTKSAWDAVYQYATNGVKVEWVIWKSGHGPVWMAPPYVTPLKKWLEKLVVTRLLTWFSPCIWGNADGYPRIRSFLHGTYLGRLITDAFWSVLGNDVITLNRLDLHPELAKLKPWSQPMFVASSFSILNYPTDFFDLVRDGKVSIHIADLACLSRGRVHLADGIVLPSDTLLCATGWKHVPPLRFLPEGTDRALGIPHRQPGAASAAAAAAAAAPSTTEEPLLSPRRVAAADREILASFPRIRDQPVQNPHMPPPPLLQQLGGVPRGPEGERLLTPYALHRFMVPAEGAQLRRFRDVAFAGVTMNFNVGLVAHAQALWIAAYFDGALPRSVAPGPMVPTSEEGEREEEEEEEEEKAMERIRHQTVLHSRFGRWRYPAGHGDKFPDFVFDAIPYLDLLLGDLGLKVHRKKGWLAEVLQPYGPEDYNGLVEEWQATQAAAGC